MTRRELLRLLTGAAGASLLASIWDIATNRAFAASQQSKKAASRGPGFHLVLNGMFLLDARDTKKLTIYAPIVPQHAYRAAMWRPHLLSDTLVLTGKYEPKPWEAGTWDQSYMPPWVPSCTGQIDCTKAQFCLSLPYPDAVYPLHAIDEARVSHSGINATNFPHALVLEYNTSPPAQIIPGVPNWSPTGNLHLYAEPNCAMSENEMQQHMKAAWGEMQKLLPQNCRSVPQPSTTQTQTVADPGVGGVDTTNEALPLFALELEECSKGKKFDWIVFGSNIVTCIPLTIK